MSETRKTKGWGVGITPYGRGPDGTTEYEHICVVWAADEDAARSAAGCDEEPDRYEPWRAPDLDGKGEEGQRSTDAELLRLAGCYSGEENRCIDCERFPMGLSQHAVCEECFLCRGCAGERCEGFLNEADQHEWTWEG